MFTNFEQFNESIKLSKAKEYTQIWKDANMQNYMSKEFDNKYRIYLPIDISSVNIEPDENIKQEIETTLSNYGYEIESYNANLCKKIGTDKNFTKITKILQKFEKPELLISYNKDHEQLTKLSNGYFVVISRHPIDIAGMTAGRRWKSCMDIESGGNSMYVEADVKAGTIIAYLIKNDDMNIENPLSRILIKPYMYEGNGKIYLMPGSTYGTISEKFEETINNWLISVQGEYPTGKFEINDELYADRQKFKFHYTKEIDEFLKTCCVNLQDVKYNEKFKTLEIKCNSFNLISTIGDFKISRLSAHEVIIDCKFLTDSEFNPITTVNRFEFKNFDSDVDNKKLENLFKYKFSPINEVSIDSNKQITSLEFLKKSTITFLSIYANVKNVEKDLGTATIDILKLIVSPTSIQSDSSLINFIPKNKKCNLDVRNIPNIYIDLGIFKNYIDIINCENLQITNPNQKISNKLSVMIQNSNITTNVEDFNAQFVKNNNGYKSFDIVDFANCTFHGKPYDFEKVFTRY